VFRNIGIYKSDAGESPKKKTNKLLLAQDNHTKATWLVAAQRGKVEVLGKLWEWAKEFLTPQDISNNLFLYKDDSERTAWHVAINTTATEL